MLLKELGDAHGPARIDIILTGAAQKASTLYGVTNPAKMHDFRDSNGTNCSVT